MGNEEDYTTEELVNLEVLTVKEAKEYVKEKTGMGDGLFNECVRPLLEFHPLTTNFKRGYPSHMVIPKKRVDRLIARWKMELLKKYRPFLKKKPNHLK